MNNLNNATRPYEEVIQTAAPDTREVKATWLGRIVQSMKAEREHMTVTAFRGCFLSSTWLIQEESGRIPSRATAKTRREAATIMVEVHCTGERRYQLCNGKDAEGDVPRPNQPPQQWS